MENCRQHSEGWGNQEQEKMILTYGLIYINGRRKRDLNWDGKSISTSNWQSDNNWGQERSMESVAASNKHPIPSLELKMQRSRLPAEVTTAQSAVIIWINRDSMIPHPVGFNVQVKYRRSGITIRSFSLTGSLDGFREASDALMISLDSATSICEHNLWYSWGITQDVFNAGYPKSTVRRT